ncbi:MAG: nucleotidyl transferase AbiEii/AbiGii toxin family protein [Longimicrobiales bacterium]|nr:nucleotidyl transferase AbiEii/AbiGii toxin family protein [Longimicrobiales bacterium]
MSPDVPASVKARLLNEAKRQGEGFELFLVRYACERFLYRLVAEKFEAMVQLGRRNSRMKDFHDIWALSQTFPFDGNSLREAISRCFARRGTAWTPEAPDALTSVFYADADVGRRWEAYCRKGQFRASPPRTMREVGDRLRAFLGPVRESIVAGSVFEQRWPAGGPWDAGVEGEVAL